MIWDTSIWRLGRSNRSKIRSVQKCYPCLRYAVVTYVSGLDQVSVRIFPIHNVPETWFTPPGWINPARRCRCHGRNGPSWKNACGLCCGSRMGRAWLRCVASSASPGLTDRARTPYRYANKLPAQIEAMIVAMRREKPTWGARKLRERLLRKLPNDVRVPACSTIHAILDRHGLVTRQRHSRTKTEGTPLSEGLAPNALWCTDYKGEFMLGDKRYCYPLTVS